MRRRDLYREFKLDQDGHSVPTSPCVDRHTRLALALVRCDEHQGGHQTLAVSNGGNANLYCSVLVFLAFHRSRLGAKDWRTYKHHQFEQWPAGFPESPTRLEEALA